MPNKRPLVNYDGRTGELKNSDSLIFGSGSVIGTSDQVQFTVRGFTTQTNNILEVQDGSANKLFYVDGNGNPIIKNTLAYKGRNAADSADLNLIGVSASDVITVGTGADKTVLNDQPTGAVDLAIATTKYVDDNDFWERTGTTLNPKTSTDQVEWDEFKYQDATTGGTDAIFIGNTGNTTNTGGYSIYIGKGTGGSITSANDNVGIGANAMPAATTAGTCVAIGTNTLLSNLSGTGNFAMGANSMRGNTTALNSVAIGVSALRNANASANVAIGASALYTNTSGANNIAIGSNAMDAGATPSLNVAIGATALKDNTTSETVAIGYNTARYNLGASNTFVGYQSGVGVTTVSTGRRSVGVVGLALNGLTTGNNNVAIGYGSGSATTTAGGCVYIGYDAGKNNNTWNQLFIANSSTTTPLIHGSFSAETVTFHGAFDIIGQNDAVQSIVKGNATQTTNLQEWQDSSSTTLALMTENGVFKPSGLRMTKGTSSATETLSVDNFTDIYIDASGNTLSLSDMIDGSKIQLRNNSGGNATLNFDIKLGTTTFSAPVTMPDGDSYELVYDSGSSTWVM